MNLISVKVSSLNNMYIYELKILFFELLKTNKDIMTKHIVYFYGSTKLIIGHNSMSHESILDRNQLIGFEGIVNDPELEKHGERCFNQVRENRGTGETCTLYPEMNITIVPFNFFYNEEQIITNLEDVIEANERYIQAESIGFPLMSLGAATSEAYDYMGKDAIMSTSFEKEFKKKWCCFGHYYLHLIKKALGNKGYLINGFSPEYKEGNLIDELVVKRNGLKIRIHADAGL